MEAVEWGHRAYGINTLPRMVNLLKELVAELCQNGESFSRNEEAEGVWGAEMGMGKIGGGDCGRLTRSSRGPCSDKN